MKEVAKKHGWGTIIGLQIILLAMLLFSIMLLFGGINAAVVDHLYLPATFCIIGGVGLLWPSLFLLRRFYRVLAGKTPDPPGAKPADAEWRAGRLFDSPVGKIALILLVLAAFAGTITFLSIVNAHKIAYGIKHNGIPWLFVGFMGLMFATLINWLIGLTAAWFRYGKGELRLVEGPGRIGGTFEARFIVHGKKRLRERLRAEVTCHRSDFRHRRANVESHTADLLFWDEIEIDPAQALRTGANNGLPIIFRIPADLPPSGTDERTRYTEWMVQITSLPGAKSFVQFQWVVPVFETGS